LRTALYNYLLAKATGGQFILRVENTDSVGFLELMSRRSGGLMGEEKDDPWRGRKVVS